MRGPMLSLNKIHITGFKNYRSTSFEFNHHIVGICGLNGQGKTNLLDAVYFSCLTKSYFTSSDAACTLFGSEGFRIETCFTNQGKTQKVVSIYRGNGRKDISLNDVPYEKFSRHIGQFPVVMVAPDDIELVNGTSEMRRKFIDTVLSQLDSAYLQELITYNKVLQQRNSLLKNWESGTPDHTTLLDILDNQLVTPGNILYEKRKAFLAELMPLVQMHYRKIAGESENISLEYNSQLNHTAFETLILQGRPKDMVLQRSQSGIHKDELGFFLNGQPFRGIASQGQRKSLLFALKLAEYDLMMKNKGFAPILLLDDVFEKLDGQRMHNLLQQVCEEQKGQVLITDTHKDRLEMAFKELGVFGQIIEL